jgi:UDP:flavonoid glycosyltransferase YjiC (YdhE family)
VRVCIIALGTRGDVEPFVALGRALRAQGHDVRLASDPMFEAFITGHDVPFAPVRVSSQALAETRFAQDKFEGKRTTVASWRAFGRVGATVVHQGFADTWRACMDAEVIVTSRVGLLIGSSMAEKLGVPLIRTDFVPPTEPATRVFRSRRLNRWSDSAFWNLVWQLLRNATNRARREVLQLPPLPRVRPVGGLDRNRALVLCAYSAHVCPPVGMPPWMRVTGYWFLDAGREWQPPRELAQFLSAGRPPVYVGFGSMKHRVPREMTAVVTAALRRAGQRGILATAWGGLDPDAASKDIYIVHDVPHDWLFQRVSAVVHHGGAGTTAAGLRAGRPTIVVPCGVSDQPFWGQRVQELGVGSHPIFRKNLTVERLSSAIEAVVTDGSLRSRAAALGARIRNERGVLEAAEILAGELRGRERLNAESPRREHEADIQFPH